MKRMCLGFAFNPLDHTVLLMRKRRPVWQAGRLNGVGGQLEGNETSRDAMVREFMEETGEHVPDFLWEHMGLLERIPREPAEEAWMVSVYSVQLTQFPCLNLHQTDETLEWVKVDTLTALAQQGQCLENIPVLVALCLLPPALPSNRRPDFVLRY